MLVAIAMALIGCFITFSFEYADHSPQPHDVKIGVVASRPSAGRLTLELAKVSPGGFTVTREMSRGGARSGILTQRISGAIVIPQKGELTIITAQAAGPALQQVVEKALTGAAVAIHRPAASEDLVPLPRNDSSGLSGFIYSLGLLVPSVLGSVGLYLVGLRARLWWRVAAAFGYSLLGALLGLLILDAGFGVLTVRPVALFAVGAFGALSFVLFVAACQATLGLPGTGVAALIMIFVGNAITSGSTPAPLLPDVYRQMSPWVPNGALVRAVRSIVYFHDHGLGQPLFAMGLWAGVALVVIAGNDVLQLTERRLSPGNARSIYATSGLKHISTKLKRRQPTDAAPVVPG